MTGIVHKNTYIIVVFSHIPLPVYNLYDVYTTNVPQHINPIIISKKLGFYPYALVNSNDFDILFQLFSILYIFILLIIMKHIIADILEIVIRKVLVIS